MKTEYSPWGAIDHVEKIAEGIEFVSTSSHGGFHLSPERLLEMPKELSNNSPWYEEDCEYGLVICAFPDCFSKEEFDSAKQTVKDWNPNKYEAFFGEKIKEGESYLRDKEIFEEKNKEKFIVISAVQFDTRMVKCIATKGGNRGTNIEEKEFAIPNKEYEKRTPFGFVIDETKHRLLDDYIKEKTSTPGWGKRDFLEGAQKLMGSQILFGNINRAIQIKKAILVVNTMPDDALDQMGTRISSLVSELSQKWNQSMGMPALEIPLDIPFMIKDDQTIYSAQGTPMPKNYEGIVLCDDAVFSTSINHTCDRDWKYWGSKKDLENPSPLLLEALRM